MEKTELKQDIPPQRLCSEIQLFDLCDLASCRHKSGRFCNNPEILERFEKIADEEFRSQELYVEEDLEENDEPYEDCYEYDDEGGFEEE